LRGIEQIPWLYDLGMAFGEARGLGRWRSWLVRGATGRTLDLGTGTGRNLPLVPPGARAVAVDPHPDALARARRRAPAVPLVVARAEALPFKDGTFDTVLAGLVLCSVVDPSAALAEARRVLRPQGALRLLEHVRAGGLVGRLQDLAQPAWTTISGGCHPNRETERAVAEAGFTVDPTTRRARGVLRRLEARAPGAASPRGAAGPEGAPPRPGSG
jgi:ubiquinone/menaquinone biosynthesis C-methylase UbiE